MLPAAFLPFIEQRPIGVMARATLERFFASEHLDRLFRQTAVEQYERRRQDGEERMGWASAAIEQLIRGETVHVRPRGHSMTGRVNDGDQVTVTPLGTRDPDVGDVVLVPCRGHEYLHLVKAPRWPCARQVADGSHKQLSYRMSRPGRPRR